MNPESGGPPGVPSGTPSGVPPGSRGFRRYWGYFNRPYPGCGCLLVLLAFALVWILLSFIFPSLAFWGTTFYLTLPAVF